MTEYQMPVLSEQDRKNLIGLARIEVKRWSSIADQQRGRFMAELMQIALAALTAKPVAVTDKSEVNGLSEDGWVGNFLAPDFRGIDVGCEVYLYAVPPVTVKQEGEQ